MRCRPERGACQRREAATSGAGRRCPALCMIFLALVLSACVLIGNPLIVLAITGVMGYRKRAGFFAGLIVAHISEFSLIFMTMGVTLGHVGETSSGLVTLVGLVIMTLATDMILYSQTLYRWLEP